METSDSECFESADEDFQSDDEDTKTVTCNPKIKKTEEKIIKDSIAEKLENLNLSQENKVSVCSRLDTEIPVPTEPVKKDDEIKELVEEKISENAEIKTVKGTDKIEVDLVSSVPNSDDRLEEKVAKNFSGDVNKLEKSETVIKREPEKVDENLWDDEELDWGKEAEKFGDDSCQTVSSKKEPAKDEEEEENMWENDNWEPIEEEATPPVKRNSPVETPTSSWGAWGNWGVSSILSTATQGVSTLTQGISNVLETGIGMPNPEEMARLHKEDKEKLKEIGVPHDDKSQTFGLGNLVSGVSHLTKLVETTGTKVISGGLDTLETIGKKTMQVLQEGDPGLKKKRAFLKIDQDKPVLSQLLREAKEKAEHENKILEQKHFAKKSKNYETLFDDHQGLVHLEALEMLSKQCDIKLQTLHESYSGDSLTELQETMEQVKELCELPDEEDDEQNNFEEIKEKLGTAIGEMNIPISYQKLIEMWEETERWLNFLKLEVCDERELHQQAIETLAQLTALAVEQFHKSGELLLVKEHRSTADEADSLVQLTVSLVALIGIAAAKFSDKLNLKGAESKNKEEINSLITNVFFEAANSSSYIQDAFQLLIPVLQVGAV